MPEIQKTRKLGSLDPSVYADSMSATTLVELSPDDVRMALIQYAAGTGRVFFDMSDGSAYVDFVFQGQDPDDPVGACVYFVNSIPGAIGDN